MVNLVNEDSSDFYIYELNEFEIQVNCGKKDHLLRVGKDFTGSHKGHCSKFPSSHFQNFLGEARRAPPLGLHSSGVGFYLTDPLP